MKKTQEYRKKVRFLYKKGWTALSLSRLFGVSLQTIYSYLGDMPRQRPVQEKRKGEQPKDEALKSKERLHTIQQEEGAAAFYLLRNYMVASTDKIFEMLNSLDASIKDLDANVKRVERKTRDESKKIQKHQEWVAFWTIFIVFILMYLYLSNNNIYPWGQWGL